jgi:hypothetical protein
MKSSKNRIEKNRKGEDDNKKKPISLLFFKKMKNYFINQKHNLIYFGFLILGITLVFVSFNYITFGLWHLILMGLGTAFVISFPLSLSLGWTTESHVEQHIDKYVNSIEKRTIDKIISATLLPAAFNFIKDYLMGNYLLAKNFTVYLILETSYNNDGKLNGTLKAKIKISYDLSNEAKTATIFKFKADEIRKGEYPRAELPSLTVEVSNKNNADSQNEDLHIIGDVRLTGEKVEHIDFKTEIGFSHLTHKTERDHLQFCFEYILSPQEEIHIESRSTNEFLLNDNYVYTILPFPVVEEPLKIIVSVINKDLSLDISLMHPTFKEKVIYDKLDPLSTDTTYTINTSLIAGQGFTISWNPKYN